MIKKINIFLDLKIVDSGCSCAYHGKQQKVSPYLVPKVINIPKIEEVHVFWSSRYTKHAI